jgi:uncharacterized protein with FMN-binding domain
MPKRGAIATLLTIAALVLLLNFKTPTVDESSVLAVGDTTPAIVEAAPTDPNATPEAAVATEPPTTTQDPTPTAQPQATVAPTATTSATIDGGTVETRFGPVQVSVTVEGGRITDITALQLPSEDRHSAAISQNVEPMLREEALQAQSANIDIVSGATYTSIGYARSLQSALDQLNG